MVAGTQAVRAAVLGVARKLVLVGSAAALALAIAAPGAQAQGPREDLVTKLTGKRIHKDKATGAVRAITADEARDLVSSIMSMTTRATPPAAVALADGSEAMDVREHVGHVVISRYNEDGSVSLRCIANADEAVAFLTEEPLEGT